MIFVMTASEVISEMKRAVPPHKAELGIGEINDLKFLTKQLIAAKPDAHAEYKRFLEIQNRSITLPEQLLQNKLGGAVILVTGGTGCVGSMLMSQLVKYRPDRLVSISRGITVNWTAQRSAEYMICDIRDRGRLDEIIAEVRPDIIFHVAAQHSPSLAEIEVHRTVTTNLFGTRNVLDSAAMSGIPQVVCASTGKALRPYSPEIYSASKRAAECYASSSCAEMLVSAARFTHVIDNSIFYTKLKKWANTEDGIVRLHSSDIVFYVQSALESSQLLLAASLGAKLDQFLIHAINDLGWPVSLLDVAIGTLESNLSCAPIYISGYDPGYEEVSFPGLYDNETAGEVSPLFNAFETAAMIDSPIPAVDVFDMELGYPYESLGLFRELEAICRNGDDWHIRSALNKLSWSLLDDTLVEVPQRVLKRTVDILNRQPFELNPIHQRITDAIRTYAGEYTGEL
jgi:hypothetical protein